MKKSFPFFFKLQRSWQWSYATPIIIFGAIIGTAASFLFLYETENKRLLYVFIGLTIIFLSLIKYIIYDRLYGTSSLEFFNDHLIGMSERGPEIRIDYSNITSIDSSFTEFGKVYKLKTDKTCLEVSPAYNNHEQIFFIVENHIRPIFEKTCLKRLKENHTFICHSTKFSKIVFYVVAFIIFSLLSFCAYSLGNEEKLSEIIALYIIFCGVGLISMFVLLYSVHTKYIVCIDGFEVKKIFSTKKYLWEQIIDIEHQYINDIVILKTIGQKEIKLGSHLNKYSAFRVVIENRLKYRTEKYGSAKSEGVF